MAYVSVPKDLTKVKNKLVFNLTRRQLICFALAAAIGLPFYFPDAGGAGHHHVGHLHGAADAARVPVRHV